MVDTLTALLTFGESDRPILMVPRGGYWCDGCSPTIPKFQLWHITHIEIRHATDGDIPDEEWDCSGKSCLNFWEYMDWIDRRS